MGGGVSCLAQRVSLEEAAVRRPPPGRATQARSGRGRADARSTSADAVGAAVTASGLTRESGDALGAWGVIAIDGADRAVPWAVVRGRAACDLTPDAGVAVLIDGAAGAGRAGTGARACRSVRTRRLGTAEAGRADVEHR